MPSTFRSAIAAATAIAFLLSGGAFAESIYGDSDTNDRNSAPTARPNSPNAPSQPARPAYNGPTDKTPGLCFALGRDGAAAFLDAINARRSAGADCGGAGKFGPQPPLRWNSSLAAAAQEHSDDMGARGYFEHPTPEGQRSGARATAHGYAWSAVGENIALGQNSTSEALRDWMSSPGHCKAIMGPYVDLGMGSADSYLKYGCLWTMVVAAPARR
jgi:uncharacterized protein YkwD